MQRLHAIVAVIAAVVCWIGTQALGRAARDARATWPKTIESAFYVPSPDSAPAMFAGSREFMADIMWAATLVYYGSSMTGEDDYRYLERFIDNVIALDPKFRRVYRWAGYAVTFQNERATQEEFRLSVKYLEQGLEQFPHGYELYWIAGMRYFLDLHAEDPDTRRAYRERGVELIEMAMRQPDAPKDLAKLAASLRLKLGQTQRALHDLREMILTTDNEEAQRVLIERYNELANTAFPEEAKQAKRAFEDSWRRELPFASPSLYIIMGDRPSPVIDFERLAVDRDLFGAEPAVGLDTDTTPRSTATGTRATTPDEWNDISRETALAAPTVTGEHQMRAFWRRWQRLVAPGAAPALREVRDVAAR